MKNLTKLLVLSIFLLSFGCKESNIIMEDDNIFEEVKTAKIDVYLKITTSDKYDQLNIGIDKLNTFEINNTHSIHQKFPIFRDLVFHPKKEQELVLLQSFDIPITTRDTFDLDFVTAKISVDQKTYDMEIISDKPTIIVMWPGEPGTWSLDTVLLATDNPTIYFQENTTTKVIFELDVDKSIIHHEGFPKYDLKPQLTFKLE